MVSDFTITKRDGTYVLSGVLNEFADFKSLISAAEPLRLDLGGLSKLNSIGVRNFLRFLSDWGGKALVFENATAEFIDQVNMIPSLKGVHHHAQIQSFYVPWQCVRCEREDEVLVSTPEVRAVLDAGDEPSRKCPKCDNDMNLLVDTFFEFLAG